MNTRRLLRGRVARPGSVAWNLTKAILQIVFLWSVFFAACPFALFKLEGFFGLDTFRFSTLTLQVTAVVLFSLGCMLGLWGAMVLVVEGKGTPLAYDAPRWFVVKGPYRYVRNPMLMGGTLQAVAVGLYLGSPLVLGYALVGGVLLGELTINQWEETELEERYGAAYLQYKRCVRRWVPRFPGYKR